MLYVNSLIFIHSNSTREILLLPSFANEEIEEQRCCMLFQYDITYKWQKENWNVGYSGSRVCVLNSQCMSVIQT